jgi:hypothetical protein
MNDKRRDGDGWKPWLQIHRRILPLEFEQSVEWSFDDCPYRPVNQPGRIFGSRPEVRSDILKVGTPLRNIDWEASQSRGSAKSLG